MTSKFDDTKRAKYKRIFSMGTDYVQRLDTLIVQKVPKATIAETIQKEWGFFNDIKLATLTRQLERYAEEIVAMITDVVVEVIEASEIEQEYIPRNVPDGAQIVALRKTNWLREKAIDTDINIYEEMLKLQRIQTERVAKLYDREVDLSGLTMGALSKEIQLLHGMNRDLAEFQFASGRLYRVPKNKITEIPSETVDQARQAHAAALKQQTEVAEAAQKVLELLGDLGGDFE